MGTLSCSVIITITITITIGFICLACNIAVGEAVTILYAKDHYDADGTANERRRTPRCVCVVW